MSESKTPKKKVDLDPRGTAEEVTDTGVALPPAPADRIRMVTWEGHEYAIDPSVMDDVHFMDLLGDLDEKPFLIVKVVKHLLGTEPRKDDEGMPKPSQWDEWQENHKDERGRVTGERLGEFMMALNKEIAALGN